MDKINQRFIELDFPLEAISAECAKEKSIRQGHISTLQQWWARRPLALCRAALFTALCPSPDKIESSPELLKILDQYGSSTANVHTKLLAFTTLLSRWSSSNDLKILGEARALIMSERTRPPLVVDTFSGGGSIPIEALRLGADSFAGELNPVAIASLRLAIELLPNCSNDLIKRFKKVAQTVQSRLDERLSDLYEKTVGVTPTAYFWCRTFICPSCGVEAPLMHDYWLDKGSRNIAVSIKYTSRSKRPTFRIISPDVEQAVMVSIGTIKNSLVTCANCTHAVKMDWIRETAQEGKLGERLYAKLIINAEGKKEYLATTATDELLAQLPQVSPALAELMDRIPSEPLDKNGIRHTWAIQYGIESTSDLYNRRQGAALAIVLDELLSVKEELIGSEEAKDAKAIMLLLTMMFNRLIVYCNRHAWWQSDGAFPANMFGRQAIPMVWNYVEIPPNNPAAAGWSSALKWIEKVALHLANLPKSGRVRLGDAANSGLSDHCVDIVAVDPPYYDTIVYSYLSDIFYVWMRPLLASVFPEDYLTSTTPKKEEAIVDRPHKAAPTPKRRQHFEQKMLQAFAEAKRILRKDGRLILMFGHKRPEAWDAFLTSVMGAGFEPIVSYPVHSERKQKFRHGKIGALSSSCLIVCRVGIKRKPITKQWQEFRELLKQRLAPDMVRFHKAQLYGADLTTSLIAPSCSLFANYAVIDERGRPLNIGDLITRLPEIAAECDLETILNHPTVIDDPAIYEAIQSLAGNSSEINTKNRSSRNDVNKPRLHWLVEAAVEYSNLLSTGKTREADLIWNGLTEGDKERFSYVLRVAALSNGGYADRTGAYASLGRIRLHERVFDLPINNLTAHIFQPRLL